MTAEESEMKADPVKNHHSRGHPAWHTVDIPVV